MVQKRFTKRELVDVEEVIIKGYFIKKTTIELNSKNGSKRKETIFKSVMDDYQKTYSDMEDLLTSSVSEVENCKKKKVVKKNNKRSNSKDNKKKQKISEKRNVSFIEEIKEKNKLNIDIEENIKVLQQADFFNGIPMIIDRPDAIIAIYPIFCEFINGSYVPIISLSNFQLDSRENKLSLVVEQQNIQSINSIACSCSISCSKRTIQNTINLPKPPPGYYYSATNGNIRHENMPNTIVVIKSQIKQNLQPL